MSLNRSQYEAIMRDYQERRLRHLQEQDARRAELYDLYPRLEEIDQAIHALKMDLAKLKIFQDPADPAGEADLRSRIQALTKERQDLYAVTGYPEDYTDLRYDCPKCKDTGRLSDGSKCSCFKQASINLLYKRSRIRDVIGSDSFDSIRLDYYPTELREGDGVIECRNYMKEIIDMVYDYAISFHEHPAESMMLIGSTGVGKTFLSHCVAREVLNQCCSVVYMTAPALIQTFEAQMRKSYDSEEDPFDADDPLLDCDLLIIDDLGTEMVNSFTISRLFYVLNERLVKGRAVLISTNLQPGDLRDLYTERISSRILSEYTSLQLVGRDIRTQRKKNEQSE